MGADQLMVLLRTVAEHDTATARQSIRTLTESPMFDLDSAAAELAGVTACALDDLTGGAPAGEIGTDLLCYLDVDELSPDKKMAVRIVLACLFDNRGDIEQLLAVATERADVDRIEVVLLLIHLTIVTLRRRGIQNGFAS